ncbi:hypothetical protein [Nocardia iowensis]|uniref:Uncharacterized protein n=1 Tax=Nocardia iowensis TaxID=204891 RepID=A0ABX8RXZ9_NOCIO|nr:hypothetical protein [Nocardia iowensis]QXN94523.1 hypothetical protein KV110_16590 [Nocardia iowensis]
MTLQADLEKLGMMSNALHSLGGEAAGLTFSAGPAGTFLDPTTNSLRSIGEMQRLAHNIQTGLVPVLSSRLHEIGDLMHQATIEFRTTEADNAADILAATYTSSSGEWVAPE